MRRFRLKYNLCKLPPRQRTIEYTEVLGITLAHARLVVLDAELNGIYTSMEEMEAAMETMGQYEVTWIDEKHV
jgi:hypothetical protein